MNEYIARLHPYHGETRPEELFEIEAALLSSQNWELVTVVPVLGKTDLISFWKREKVATVSEAITNATATLDAAIKDIQQPVGQHVPEECQVEPCDQCGLLEAEEIALKATGG